MSLDWWITIRLPLLDLNGSGGGAWQLLHIMIFSGFSDCFAWGIIGGNPWQVVQSIFTDSVSI